jgi:hypothetical protein
MSNYATLAAIDVSKYTEKKGPHKLEYLSWPIAVDFLMRADPMATWEFHQPQAFADTLMVSCTVTAFGKPITMHLPVMDHRNQAIPNPDAFAVNKNMMRCLVKAIACHGLGIKVYAGEDLPGEEAARNTKLLDQDLVNIEGAKNAEELQKVFKQAVENHHASRESVQIIIAAKDQRKNELGIGA